jgi:hypothetical protein
MTQALPEQVLLDVRDRPDLELERAYADRLMMLRRGRPSPQALAASDVRVRELELRLMTSTTRDELSPRIVSTPSPSHWWG